MSDCAAVEVLCLQAKVVIAEQTEKDIDETRSLYIPVAVNTQILFFCVADLSNIDPMYQYSLEWFIAIFLGGIANAERAGRFSNHKAPYNSLRRPQNNVSSFCRSVDVSVINPTAKESAYPIMRTYPVHC